MAGYLEQTLLSPIQAPYVNVCVYGVCGVNICCVCVCGAWRCGDVWCLWASIGGGGGTGGTCPPTPMTLGLYDYSCEPFVVACLLACYRGWWCTKIPLPCCRKIDPKFLVRIDAHDGVLTLYLCLCMSVLCVFSQRASIGDIDGFYFRQLGIFITPGICPFCSE